MGNNIDILVELTTMIESDMRSHSHRDDSTKSWMVTARDEIERLNQVVSSLGEKNAALVSEANEALGRKVQFIRESSSSSGHAKP
jgi:archaellum component FlaC